MQINKIHRPWQPKYRNRPNSNDRRYHTQAWRITRQNHINGITHLPDGRILANKYCVQCYTQDNKFTPVHTVDHVETVRNGADFYNGELQSLCLHHNAVKTAKDGQK